MLSDDIHNLQDIIRQLELKINEVLTEKDDLLNHMEEKDTIAKATMYDLEKQKDNSLEQYRALAKQNGKIEEQTKFLQQISEKNEKLQKEYNNLTTSYNELKLKEEKSNEVMHLTELKLKEKDKNIDELETQILELMMQIEDRSR
jgi:chromosome segregation ATPase